MRQAELLVETVGTRNVSDNSSRHSGNSITVEPSELDANVNGQEAVERVASEPYDAVLMDIQMPILDGYEATRNIRENPEWQDLPVIAVTANVMQGDRDDCLESGMNDYITIPYNRADLKSIIDRWAPPQPPED